jgi:threonine/homoserine/homoserine lactone efflux protein
MTFAELSLAIFVLLVTPGPTNTLLFLAGSERGTAAALRLIPAEVAGYLCSVLPLMLVGAALMARVPMAQPLITVLASVWVAVLAVRLYRLPEPGQTHIPVDAKLVFVTTLLNPKALIFGLVLLPGPTATTNLLIFLAMVGLVATAWAAAGAGLQRRTGAAMPFLRRIAALWLVVVSATLMLRGLTA